MSGGALDDLAIAVPLSEEGRQEHAGLIADDPQQGAELLVQGGDEGASPLTADQPGSPKVPVEVPIANEIRQDARDEERREHVRGPADCEQDGGGGRWDSFSGFVTM